GSSDDRSTRYASDLAKGFEIPIVHVNADDPEACLNAVHLAYHYRKTFGKDFLIDLVGYRRYGHNETDDPAVTQPTLYKKIDNHPDVRALYADKLQSEGIITEEQSKQMEEDFTNKLREVYEQLDPKKDTEIVEPEPPETVAEKLPPADTSVSLESLREINRNLLKWPEG